MVHANASQAGQVQNVLTHALPTHGERTVLKSVDVSVVKFVIMSPEIASVLQATGADSAKNHVRKDIMAKTAYISV